MEQQILQLLGGTGGQGKSPGGSSFPRLTSGPTAGGLGNSIVPAPDTMSGLDPAIADLLRRMTAFRGGGMEGILALLNDVIGGGNDGGGFGGGGGGGGGGCLAGDVLVRMADGSEKRAEDIRVDDVIMGLDFDLGPTPQTVSCTNSSRQLCYMVTLSNGIHVEASSSHRWFGIGKGLILTPHLECGQGLFGEDDEEVTVVEVVNTGVKVVHWWNCDPNHCYYAGGVLHHNITKDTWGKPPIFGAPGSPPGGGVSVQPGGGGPA